MTPLWKNVDAWDIRVAEDWKAMLACDAKLAALIKEVATVVDVVRLAAVWKATAALFMKVDACWKAIEACVAVVARTVVANIVCCDCIVVTTEENTVVSDCTMTGTMNSTAVAAWDWRTTTEPNPAAITAAVAPPQVVVVELIITWDCRLSAVCRVTAVW